jgi:hypothetical protein
VAERVPVSRAALLILFAAAFAISAFTILRDIDPFDEGLMLQAAARIAHGQVPYKDFLWSYGPAQPYLLAGMSKVFGASLLDWRILRSLCDAGVAVLTFQLARSRVSNGPALVCWLAVACEMAQPRSANPFALALLLVLIATAADRPGLWLTLAAAVRLDFFVYGLLAVCAGVFVRYGRRRALVTAGWSLLGCAVVYLPFAISDGPGHLYTALIGTSLSTGGDWTLPFPLHYHAAAGQGFGQAVKHFIDFYAPLLCVVAYTGLTLLTALRLRRDALAVALAVLGLGMLVYLRSRTDEFHTQALFVVVAIGLAMQLTDLRRAEVRLGCCALLALLLVHGAGNRVSALTRPPAESPIRIAVADGVQAPPPEARAVEQLVAIVDRAVPARDPIYVVPRRSDLVRIGDPLIYVLTQRSNPTYQDFGLQTGAGSQQGIVAMLTGVRPRVVVRWTDPISSQAEPNARGRSSGVHTVDVWLARHYRLLARLYHYDVLVPRSPRS